MRFAFDECFNKTIIIKLIEDDEINTEFSIINNKDDYDYLKNYIDECLNNNILYDYYIYEE